MGDGPIVVVSAHAADFVWRAGGVIALSAATGRQVRVVCLSYGERGESQGLWREPDMTLERVKDERAEESSAAAKILGAEITFLDAGDYPLGVDDALFHRLVDELRDVQPTMILTHAAADPYNEDHEVAARFTLRARMVAQAAGHQTSSPPIGAPEVLRFEPHQPEMCGFQPDVLVDITPVFDKKRAAMEQMKAQEHLVDYYTDLALRRAVQARRNGGASSVRHAEAFQRVFPQVVTAL